MTPYGRYSLLRGRGGDGLVDKSLWTLERRLSDMGSKKRWKKRVESDSRSAGGNYSHLTRESREADRAGAGGPGACRDRRQASCEQSTDMTSDTGECTIRLIASLIRAPRLRMR